MVEHRPSHPTPLLLCPAQLQSDTGAPGGRQSREELCSGERLTGAGCSLGKSRLRCASQGREAVEEGSPQEPGDKGCLHLWSHNQRTLGEGRARKDVDVAQTRHMKSSRVAVMAGCGFME